MVSQFPPEKVLADVVKGNDPPDVERASDELAGGGPPTVVENENDDGAGVMIVFGIAITSCAATV